MASGAVRCEAAKRRLLFELGELGLPIQGLSFDLLSSAAQSVTTGHADGVVTLDLAEADDPHRERMRQELSEPYRTLLGHFRHEVGHFYFIVLAPDEERRERVRALFFLYAIHRFHLPLREGVATRGLRASSMAMRRAVAR